MGNAYSDIRESLIRLFKGLRPAFDVTGEELSRVDGEDPEAASENYVFLDITPAGNETVNAFHTDRRVLVDAAIHTAEEQNANYLALAAAVDGRLRPVFRFGDRAVTVPGAEYKIVDRVLHCVFTLAFRDSVEAPEPYPIMEELTVSITTERT